MRHNKTKRNNCQVTGGGKASKKKKPRKNRCWIEDCPETETASGDAVDVTILISRVLLFDEHSSSRIDLPRATATSDTTNTTAVATVDAGKVCAAMAAEPSTTSIIFESATRTPEHAEQHNHGEKSPCLNAATHDNVKQVNTINETTTTKEETSRAAGNAGACKETVAPQSHSDRATDGSQKSSCHVTGPLTFDRTTSTAAAVVEPTIPQTTKESPDAQTVQEPSSPPHEDKLGVTGSGAAADANQTCEEPRLNARITVRRHVSAHGAVIFPRTGFVHLPNGDCGDGIVNPHPDTVDDKYWAQRHRLFARFEQGIQLDREGWFSVTPETIATHVAKKMTFRAKGGMIVLDAFVGVGGNAIALAQRDEVSLVICCDTDPDRLALAANNCKVYEIAPENVIFVCADAVEVLKLYEKGVRVKSIKDSPKYKEKDDGKSGANDQVQQHGYKFVGLEQLPEKVDAVFLSPPWGGSEYANQRHFDLESIKVNEMVNGDDLLELATRSMPVDNMNVAYFLPRNTNGWRVGQSAYRAGIKHLEMEQNYLNNKLKTITVYVRSGGDENVS